MSGFNEGELIISSAPYAYVLDDGDRGQFCDYCFLKNDKLKLCGQCFQVYYCDKSCQRYAWNMHKTECKFLKGRSMPRASVRLIILVLMKIKKYGYDEPFEVFGNRKASMATLMSHVEDFKDKYLIMVFLEKILIELLIGSDNVPPFNEFAEIYGKIQTNKFAIQHLLGGPDGIGLYLGPSFFDHSCDADAAYIFDGTTLNVRMMKSVPHRNLNLVRISYLNKPSLKEEKVKLLMETKFFTCSCAICTSSKSDEYLTKLVSDAPEIKEKAIKCKECVEYLLSKGPSIDEPQQLYNECKKLLKSQSGVLADTNIYRIRTLEQAFQACLRLLKLADAVELAIQLEKPYRLYYSTNHPSLAYFLFQYGRSLCLLKRYRKALSILSEAETKLKITYGEHHPVVQNLKGFKLESRRMRY